MQRLGCNNSAHTDASQNNAATNVSKIESGTPEIKVAKESTQQVKNDLAEIKGDKISGSTKNAENDSKTKLDKALRGGEWDMFADQDNFDSVDVS